MLFSGVAASNLGMNVEVVTKCSAEDKPVFQKIFAPRCVGTPRSAMGVGPKALTCSAFRT